MFIGQFFENNTDIIVIDVLKTILRVQIYFENNILMEYTKNNLYFETHM